MLKIPLKIIIIVGVLGRVSVMAIFRPHAQHVSTYIHPYIQFHVINRHVTDNPRWWGRAARPGSDGA